MGDGWLVVGWAAAARRWRVCGWEPVVEWVARGLEFKLYHGRSVGAAMACGFGRCGADDPQSRADVMSSNCIIKMTAAVVLGPVLGSKMCVLEKYFELRS